jgi:hypothetical protein
MEVACRRKSGRGRARGVNLPGGSRYFITSKPTAVGENDVDLSWGTAGTPEKVPYPLFLERFRKV